MIFTNKNFSVSFSELNFMIIKSDDQVPLYFLKKKVLPESICFPMCLGKWNVLRPISLLDIKDVKPTPKEHDGGKEWKEV